jgi:DNA-directed RNA polymerase specialized sigma24 family protein
MRKEIAIDQDSALLLAAQDGDQHSFGRLLCRHRRGLELYCFLMIGDLDAVAELMENAVLTAWREREVGGRCTGAEIWLYGVATRECFRAIGSEPPPLQHIDEP